MVTGFCARCLAICHLAPRVAGLPPETRAGLKPFHFPPDQTPNSVLAGARRNIGHQEARSRIGKEAPPNASAASPNRHQGRYTRAFPV